MKYYILSNATDEKEIGKKYPQCKGVPEGYTFTWYDEPNSMTKLTNEEFPKEKPDLVFELHEKAILTDVISPDNISARGMLINEKTKELLNNFKLLEHRIYPATLFANRQMHKYYWVHFYKDNFSGLDFKNSNFIEVNLMKRKIKSVDVNSLEDYNFFRKNKEKKSNSIVAEKLILNDSFKNLDVFLFPLVHDYLIISKKIYECFQDNQISGVKYKEATFIN